MNTRGDVTILCDLGELRLAGPAAAKEGDTLCRVEQMELLGATAKPRR